MFYLSLPPGEHHHRLQRDHREAVRQAGAQGEGRGAEETLSRVSTPRLCVVQSSGGATSIMGGGGINFQKFLCAFIV